jgi:BolA protein
MTAHDPHAPAGTDDRDSAHDAGGTGSRADSSAAATSGGALSTGAQRMALIRSRLAALEPDLLDIDDESHLHAGHAGAEGGASHFRVRIVSPRFAGLTPVARHRLVYHQLADLIPFPIHALALETPAFKE